MNFSCPSCNITLQAEPELAGKTVKCPGCSTKIQIPDDFGAPPAPDAAHSDAAADELADEHYDSIPELNVGVASSGPHPSTVNIWVAGGIGVGFTFILFLVMMMIQDTVLGKVFIKMSGEGKIDLGGTLTQLASTFMTGWCIGILILKSINIRKQKRAMLLQALPMDIDEEISPSNLKAFHDNILNYPKPLRNTFIVNRIRKALEFFYVRQNNPEVAQMIASQSEVDANKVAGSYSIVKVFLWAIPIMGFIGTVLGIGAAIGDFGGVLSAGDAAGEGGTDGIMDALTPVLGSMGTAFDTTLLALVFSIILAFPASSLQSQEEDLITDVDEYCIDNLLKRLNDGGAATNFDGDDAGLLRAIGDAMANNQKDIMGRFENVQQGMSKSLSDQTKQYEIVATAVDKQLEAIGDRAKNYETKMDEEFFNNLDRIRSESVTAIGSQVNGLAEGIKNLNEVLKDLNGKQVVVQKKGWFGR